MQGNSRSRRRPPKPRLEPISYEEMVGAAGMSGFVSFLEISPTDSNQQSAAPVTREFPSPTMASTEHQGRETASDPPDHYSGIPIKDSHERGIPETGTPDNKIYAKQVPQNEDENESGAPVVSTPDIGIPDSTHSYTDTGAPEIGIPDLDISFKSSDVLDPSTVDLTQRLQPAVATPKVVLSKEGIPDSGAPLFVPYTRSHCVRRATRVQDGHSLGEQALYDALWQAGRPYSDDARIITVGYRNMSEIARLTVNNCKANIRALIQKLAVAEAAPFSHSQGTTYIVYNFGAILQRRKAAGLTHCIRSRGVLFVDPESGTPITVSTHLKSGIPRSGMPHSAGTPESGKSGIPHSDKGGVPETGPQREEGSTRKPQDITSTSLSVPERLVTGLHQLVSFFDGEAVTLLWNECQMRAPDCTIDEVLYFARQKTSVCRNGKIQNPVGFLLTAVPKCFEGEPFQHFRAERVKLNEEERKRKEAEQEKARLQAAELHREEELYRLAEQKLQALSADEYQALHDAVRSELTRSWKNFSLLTEQARELNIRSRILREFRDKESRRK